MKRKIVLLITLCVLFCGIPTNIKSQSLSDILNSVIKGATSVLTKEAGLSVNTLKGTWLYDSPAVVLETNDALKSIAGSLISAELEKKLDEYCMKAGIEKGIFYYKFNQDLSFTNQLKGEEIKGAYAVDSKNNTITLTYTLADAKILSLVGDAQLSQGNLLILFDADKLMELLTTISAITTNSTIRTLSALLNEYQGVKLGFALKK